MRFPDPVGAQRRRAGLVAVQLGLAALFLAVIGGSVGFIIGTVRSDSDNLPRRATALPPPALPSVDPALPAPAATIAAAPTATAAAPTATGPVASRPPGGELCPEHTQRMARERAGSPGYLRQVLRVRTARSAVWICRDAAGVLFYQGLVGAGVEFREGVNALFLAGVVPTGAGYRATNVVDGRATHYDVTTAKLVIRTGADVRTEPVTAYQ